MFSHLCKVQDLDERKQNSSSLAFSSVGLSSPSSHPPRLLSSSSLSLSLSPVPPSSRGQEKGTSRHGRRAESEKEGSSGSTRRFDSPTQVTAQPGGGRLRIGKVVARRSR